MTSINMIVMLSKICIKTDNPNSEIFFEAPQYVFICETSVFFTYYVKHNYFH